MQLRGKQVNKLVTNKNIGLHPNTLCPMQRFCENTEAILFLLHFLLALLQITRVSKGLGQTSVQESIQEPVSTLMQCPLIPQW